jgi:hypothetical protein
MSTTDPLLDSDNELELEGEHIRRDYSLSRCLHFLNLQSHVRLF